MPTCPSGHDSASTDFCDVCGMRMDGARRPRPPHPPRLPARPRPRPRTRSGRALPAVRGGPHRAVLRGLRVRLCLGGRPAAAAAGSAGPGPGAPAPGRGLVDAPSRGATARLALAPGPGLAPVTARPGRAARAQVPVRMPAAGPGSVRALEPDRTPKPCRMPQRLDGRGDRRPCLLRQRDRRGRPGRRVDRVPGYCPERRFRLTGRGCASAGAACRAGSSRRST